MHGYISLSFLRGRRLLDPGGRQVRARGQSSAAVSFILLGRRTKTKATIFEGHPPYPWQVRGSDGFTASSCAGIAARGRGPRHALLFRCLPSAYCFHRIAFPDGDPAYFSFSFFFWLLPFLSFPPSSLATPDCYFVLRSLLL